MQSILVYALSRLSSAEQYDPERNEWTAFSSLLQGRWGHALVNVDGVLLAISGSDGKDVESVERFDETCSQWQAAAPLNIGRWGLAAAVVQVGSGCAFGSRLALRMGN